MRFDMKVTRIVKLNEPLRVQELQTATPKDTQILGVYHSDVHRATEALRMLKEVDRDVINPLKEKVHRWQDN
ncbi:MAG: hypothetical protein WAM14_22770 [Candidatus Nitrosopolaris sp.]